MSFGIFREKRSSRTDRSFDPTALVPNDDGVHPSKATDIRFEHYLMHLAHSARGTLPDLYPPLGKRHYAG